MIGMAIAIATTLAIAKPEQLNTWLMIFAGIGLGGVIGAVTARRIPMTSMPELVAAFHSLVGLAAVFVAAAALYAPDQFGIGSPGNIGAASLLEMSLGVAIGALTFTGSIIAFRQTGRQNVGFSDHASGASCHQWCSVLRADLADLSILHVGWR